ncbi:ATP-dependent DNA ligase [Paenibacillus sp. MBLB4367]|uniref:ATP-dependent DNA ligase n=1 Tax=Paenibacillus sp. MBLB4367 TaxID=3384767 RepID=UPI003907EDEE
MFISPMLLETAPTAFNDERYVFEPKIDGHRLLIVRQIGVTRIYTRHGNEVTRLYPELWDVPMDGDGILDGEGAVIDPASGQVDFELMQERSKITRQDKIVAAMQRLPVSFFCFDILQRDGRDLRRLPLTDRKKILDATMGQNEHFSSVTSVPERGEDLFAIIRERKMEGIVGKRIDSKYVSRRSDAWLKIINWQYENVYITGYRKNEFGWLASVPGKDDRLRPAGIIELGVTPRHKMAFYSVRKSLVTGEDKDFVYMEPLIKAKVKIRNWTKNGMLRSPAMVDFLI